MAIAGWLLPVTVTFTTAAAFCWTRALKSGTVMSTRTWGVASTASAGDMTPVASSALPATIATAIVSVLSLLGTCMVVISLATSMSHGDRTRSGLSLQAIVPGNS